MSLFEPELMTGAVKQELKGFIQWMTVLHIFLYIWNKGGNCKEDYMKEGKSKVGKSLWLDYRINNKIG